MKPGMVPRMPSLRPWRIKAFRDERSGNDALGFAALRSGLGAGIGRSRCGCLVGWLAGWLAGWLVGFFSLYALPRCIQPLGGLRCKRNQKVSEGKARPDGLRLSGFFTEKQGFLRRMFQIKVAVPVFMGVDPSCVDLILFNPVVNHSHWAIRGLTPQPQS